MLGLGLDAATPAAPALRGSPGVASTGHVYTTPSPALLTGTRRRPPFTPEQKVLRVLADEDPHGDDHDGLGNGADSDDDGGGSIGGGSSSDDEIDVAELELLGVSSAHSTPIGDIIDLMLTPCGAEPDGPPGGAFRFSVGGGASTP